MLAVFNIVRFKLFAFVRLMQLLEKLSLETKEWRGITSIQLRILNSTLLDMYGDISNDEGAAKSNEAELDQPIQNMLVSQDIDNNEIVDVEDDEMNPPSASAKINLRREVLSNVQDAHTALIELVKAILKVLGNLLSVPSGIEQLQVPRFQLSSSALARQLAELRFTCLVPVFDEGDSCYAVVREVSLSDLGEKDASLQFYLEMIQSSLLDGIGTS